MTADMEMGRRRGKSSVFGAQGATLRSSGYFRPEERTDSRSVEYARACERAVCWGRRWEARARVSSNGATLSRVVS